MTSWGGYGSAVSLTSLDSGSPFMGKSFRKSSPEAAAALRRKHAASDEETPLVPPTTPDTSQGSLHAHELYHSDNERHGSDLEHKDERLSWTLLVTVFVVTLGSSFQFGYGTGVMNNSRVFIMDYFVDQGKEYTLIEWGTVVSAYGVGGLLGSILGPKVIGLYTGRRGTLLVNNVFLFASSYLIAFAQYWWWQVIGRIAIGIVAGVATAVVPTYLAEISPLAVRGGVATIHQLAITIGILVSQFLSTPSLHLFGSQERWKWLFFVPAVCGFVQIIVLPLLPESPSYLYLQGDRTGARHAIVRFQSEDVADEYLGYIEEEAKASESSSSQSMTVAELFQERSLRKQLVVGVVVQLMMQFSGKFVLGEMFLKLSAHAVYSSISRLSLVFLFQVLMPSFIIPPWYSVRPMSPIQNLPRQASELSM